MKWKIHLKRKEEDNEEKNEYMNIVKEGGSPEDLRVLLESELSHTSNMWVWTLTTCRLLKY